MIRLLTGLLIAWSLYAAPRVPGTIIDYSPAASGKYIGSPSVAILANGTYIASHDFFGPQSGYRERAVSRIFESRDKGRHWTPIAEINGMFWGTLFVHRDAVYLIGTTKEYGDAIIRRSTDGGRNWTEPKDGKTGLLLAGPYHCAPQPVVVHAGRIWRGMEDTRAGGGWGKHFRAFMMSAPVDADLLKSESWTLSNALARDAAWLDGKFGGWLEGNAVVEPAGGIADILRVDYAEDGKAAVVHISPDGATATFDPAKDFIHLPGGAKKFTIRYDSKSRKYWSLVNYVPPVHKGPNAAAIRNTLALVCSPDLASWEIRAIVLHHPDTARHAFQYADWLFEGDDLIAVVRTAFDDAAGGAHNAHDANYMTFHRIRNFRKMKMRDSVVKPRELGIN